VYFYLADLPCPQQPSAWSFASSRIRHPVSPRHPAILFVSTSSDRFVGAADHELIMGMPSHDIVGITSHGLFWTVVEVNIALIACCLPTMRPIMSMRAFRNVFGSRLRADGLHSHVTGRDVSRGTGVYSNARASRGSFILKGSSYTLASMPQNDFTSPSASDMGLVEQRA
jgi:hypothetical protein